VDDHELVDSRFIITGLFRSGAVGALYRAVDRQSGEPVAVKLLQVRDARLEKRLLAEARLLAGLHHPNIVRYIAHGSSAAGLPYLVTEWLDGETLRERLQRGRLSAAESIGIAWRVADALSVAHAARVVHRDVKPSNIMLVDGDLDQVKLIDFGVAQDAADGCRLTKSGESVGTPYYMAPEQIRGLAEIDGRADLFALGCVLYESLTGERAFEAENELEVWLKILLTPPPPLRSRQPLPPSLVALIARLQAKQPAARPPSASEVAKSLRELPAVAEAASPPEALDKKDEKTDQLDASVLRSRAPSTFLLVALLPPAPHDADGRPRRRRELLASVDALARSYNGRADLLGDTAALLILDGDAAAATGCAFRLRRSLPGAVVALAGSERRGASAVDDYLIMRAAGVLEAVVFDGATVDGVLVDAVTAPALGDGCNVQPVALGTYCLRED
jgi:serine/threonine protein kinase